MSKFKEVYADIADMIEAGCSTGYIASEIIRNYPLIKVGESYRLIQDVRQLMTEDDNTDFLSGALTDNRLVDMDELQRAIMSGE